MATKNMLVRIGADLSDLKSKTKQAKSLFEKLGTVRSSAAQNHRDDIAKEVERARAQVAGLEGDYKRLTASGGMAAQEKDIEKQMAAIEKKMAAIKKPYDEMERASMDAAAKAQGQLDKLMEKAAASADKIRANTEKTVESIRASAGKKLDKLQEKYDSLFADDTRAKKEKGMNSALQQTEKEMQALEKSNAKWTFQNGDIQYGFTDSGIKEQYDALAERAAAIKEQLAAWRVNPAATGEAKKLQDQMAAIRQEAEAAEEKARASESAQLDSLKGETRQKAEPLYEASREKLDTAVDPADQAAYTQLETQLEALKEKLDQLRLNPEATEEAQTLAEKLDEARQRAAELETELGQADKTATLENVKNKLAQIAGRAGSAVKGLGKMGLQMASGGIFGKVGGVIGGLAGKIGGFAGGLAKAFGQVLRYRLACEVFENVSNAMNAMLTSDSVLNSNLSKSAGNLLTAVMPIYNAILPLLREISAIIQTVTAQIATLIATLFGTTVKQASATASKINGVANSAAGGGSKAADKMKRTVMGFDKLNKVDAKDSSGGGGGGGGSAGAITPDITGQGAELPPWMQKVQKGLENLRDAFKALRENFLEAWNMDGVGDRITAAFGEIGNRILDCWVNITQQIKEWAQSLDFTPLLTAFANLSEALVPIVDLICDGLEWAFQNVLLPLGKWTIEEGLPALLNALASALTFVSTVCEKLKAPAQWVWEHFLQPIASWTGDAIVTALTLVGDTFDWLTALINGDKEGMDKAAADMSVTWEKFKQKTLETLQKLGSGVSELYDKAEQKLLEFNLWLADKAVEGWNNFKAEWDEALGNIKAGLGRWWEEIKADVKKFITDPIQWGKDLIDNFVKGIRQAKQNAKNAIGEIGEIISEHMHHSTPEKGALKDDDKWMPDMMQNFTKGIRDNRRPLLAEAESLAGALNGSLNGALEGAVSASVRTGRQAGMPDNSAAIITVLEQGFRSLRRSVEDKDMRVELDGETVSRSVTARQNRRELMRGRPVTP